MVDDDPGELEKLAAADESVRQVCDEVRECASKFEFVERHADERFIAPVDPSFIEAWRIYEERYADPIGAIVSADLEGWAAAAGLELEPLSIPGNNIFEQKWNYISYEAKRKADAVMTALVFAEDRAFLVSDDLSSEIEDGVQEWRRLISLTGFELEGVFRRRDRVPFVLVPHHVSMKYGSAEVISLYTLLRQAHNAFILGVPFAALALMQSLLEVILRDHSPRRGKIGDAHRLSPTITL